MRRAVELRPGASPTPRLIDGGGRAGPALPQPLPGVVQHFSCQAAGRKLGLFCV